MQLTIYQLISLSDKSIAISIFTCQWAPVEPLHHGTSSTTKPLSLSLTWLRRWTLTRWVADTPPNDLSFLAEFVRLGPLSFSFKIIAKHLASSYKSIAWPRQHHTGVSHSWDYVCTSSCLQAWGVPLTEIRSVAILGGTQRYRSIVAIRSFPEGDKENDPIR